MTLPRETSQRRGLSVLAGILVLGCLLQLLPLFIWAVAIAPDLRLEQYASRLSVSEMTTFPEPPAAWAQLRVGEISLRAPIAAEGRGPCPRCSDQCLIHLDRGTLALLPERAPPLYQQALDDFAPDERDLSPLRSVHSNWLTIDALAARVRSPSQLPRVFRFEANESKGLVTIHRASVGEALVIYVYSPDEVAQQIVGLAGLEAEDAYRVIGSIESSTLVDVRGEPNTGMAMAPCNTAHRPRATSR